MPAVKKSPPRRSAKTEKAAAQAPDDRVVVENVNVPGYTSRVDAGMYHAMRQAMLKATPAKAPGLTQEEMRAAVLPYLPEALFPGGAKVGWWAKCVQLDLEAKGALLREPSKPLRWHRAPKK